MTDQQQPPAPGYPGFELTTAGLEAFYREFGRLSHQMFEAEGKATRMTDLLRQVQAQIAPQQEPAAETAEPTPIKAKAGG